MKKVVVVAPTYNEKDNIEKLAESILSQEQYVPEMELHVLFSDSHSNDGTIELAKKLEKGNSRIHYLDVKKRGIGVGIMLGMDYAIETLGADVLMMIDADLSHDPAAIPSFMQKIQEGYTLVIGSRYIRGGANKLSFHRQIFSLAANTLVRFVIGLTTIHEFTTSYRALTKELFQNIDRSKIPWMNKSFVFQPAFVYVAVTLAGAKATEVPIIFRDRQKGRSKMATFRYIYELTRYIFAIRFKRFRRAKTFVKFGIVGLTGTVVDFIFYVGFINFMKIPPPTSKAFSTEIAIINNFTWNNAWTFRHRNNSNPTWKKFLIFNFISLGGLALAVLIVKFLTDTFGKEGYIWYFFATIPIVMIWNFFMNHFVTWRNKPV